MAMNHSVGKDLWGQAQVCCLMGVSAISVDCKHTESQPSHGIKDGANVMSSSLQPSVIEQRDAHSSPSCCALGMGQGTVTFPGAAEPLLG